MGHSEDRELLISLLARIQGERRPEETADRLLSHYGSLQSLVECLPAQDDSLSVSQNVRMLLNMIPGLCRRRELDRLGEHPLLDTLPAAARFVQSLYIGVQYEQIYLLCLDDSLRLIRHILLSEGSAREVPFYPRRIMQEALGCGAQAVILCHNHLSSWCFFSEADQTATKEFLKLCTYIQLPLLDHLLSAGDQISSMRSKAHIPESDWRAASPMVPPLSRWRTPSKSSITLLPPDGSL